jgi:uncharacterized membrane protein YdjX (TVP38/TMEM64 family)
MGQMRISKKLLLLVALCAGAAVAYFSPLRDTLSNWHEVGAYLSSQGIVGQLLFVVAVAVLCAIGMPRLLAYAISGWAYGLLWGLVLAQVGAMAGAYATFVFARWSGSEVMLRRWPGLQKFLNAVECRGIVSVLILRQIPVNSFFSNILIGLSTISHRDFLIGSFIGFLPEGIPAVLLGSGLPTGNLDRIVQLSLAAAFLLVFLVWLLRFFSSRSSEKKFDALRSHWHEILLMTFCGIAGVMFYFVNGIPVLDMWEPGIRLDVSGVESLPGADFLLAANDHGHLKGAPAFFLPSLVLVDLEHYPHITHMYLDPTDQIDVTHKKWDAESIRCQVRSSGEVLCFMVSGRLRELVWMTAPSVSSVKQGHFTIRGNMDIGAKLSMRDTQEIEAIVFMNSPAEPVRLLLVGRYPKEMMSGRVPAYPEYILAFSGDTASPDAVSGSLSALLPMGICQSADGKEDYGNRISDLGRLGNTQKAILVCTAEKAESSYLVPVHFTQSGIVADADAIAMRVEKSDFDGHAPHNLKLEGVTCLQGNVVVSIDSDSYEGGVYRLGNKFSPLCQRTDNKLIN